jgi:hypothetical protein
MKFVSHGIEEVTNLSRTLRKVGSALNSVMRQEDKREAERKEQIRQQSRPKLLQRSSIKKSVGTFSDVLQRFANKAIPVCTIHVVLLHGCLQAL